MDRELPGVFGLAFKLRKDVVPGDNVLILDANCVKDRRHYNGEPVVTGMALTVWDGSKIAKTESISGHKWVTVLVPLDQANANVENKDA
jgi:hypothetical protein